MSLSLPYLRSNSSESCKVLKDVKKREIRLHRIEEISNKTNCASHTLIQAVWVVRGACLLELLSVDEVVKLYGSVQMFWVLSQSIEGEEHIPRASHTMADPCMKQENDQLQNT